MSKYTLREIVNMRMCLGCGACAYIGESAGIKMVDYPSVGRRPFFPVEVPKEISEEIEDICPGIKVATDLKNKDAAAADDDQILIGPAHSIWEGWADDEKIRYSASSGGILTALADFCLNSLEMDLVVHTGMDSERPWMNTTVISRTSSELYERCTSRYAPSSPVELLAAIENNDKPCVFIGKPCDVAAVSALRKRRPKLDSNLGLVLSFFCAGTPSTNATLELLSTYGVTDYSKITDIHYRGKGWPGNFRASTPRETKVEVTYDDSWGQLAARHRQLRCHLCPDGLGELADISSGDAWHRRKEGSDGISIILARSQRGHDILIKAIDAGVIRAEKSNAANVVRAQGLTERRKLVGTRIKALRLFRLPAPEFPGFFLNRASAQLGLFHRCKNFFGMIKRIIFRGFFKVEQRE